MIPAIFIVSVDDPRRKFIVGLPEPHTFQDLIATRGAAGIDDVILFATEHVIPTPEPDDSEIPPY